SYWKPLFFSGSESACSLHLVQQVVLTELGHQGLSSPPGRVQGSLDFDRRWSRIALGVFAIVCEPGDLFGPHLLAVDQVPRAFNSDKQDGGRLAWFRFALGFGLRLNKLRPYILGADLLSLFGPRPFPRPGAAAETECSQDGTDDHPKYH